MPTNKQRDPAPLSKIARPAPKPDTKQAIIDAIEEAFARVEPPYTGDGCNEWLARKERNAAIVDAIDARIKFFIDARMKQVQRQPSCSSLATEPDVPMPYDDCFSDLDEFGD